MHADPERNVPAEQDDEEHDVAPEVEADPDPHAVQLDELEVEYRPAEQLTHDVAAAEDAYVPAAQLEHVDEVPTFAYWPEEHEVQVQDVDAPKTIFHPLDVTVLSEVHLMESPAAIKKPAFPVVVPEYPVVAVEGK